MKFIQIDSNLPPEVKEIEVECEANQPPRITQVIAWDDKLILRPEDYSLEPYK